MDRVKIENIINKLDDISQRNYDDDFNLAVYIYLQYGIFQFENYINDDELEEINKVLKNHSTFFDENINDEVIDILDDDEWEG